MANTYYVDPEATGDNDGTSWDNAWTALQSAATNAAAGDIVYCRGTETIAAEIDFAASGTYDAYIKFIGCNAAGANDGTFYEINGGDADINGLDIDGDYIWFENFKIHSCDGTAAIDGSSSGVDHGVYVNVWCHDNAAYGFNSSFQTRYATFVRCRFSNNTSGGMYRPNNCRFFACSFDNNTGVGYTENTNNLIIHSCIFRDNTANGATLYGTPVVFNCIFEDNGGDGCYASYQTAGTLFVGCRFTNNDASGKYGLNIAENYYVGLLGCYFGNNATDINGRYYVLPIDGSTTHVVLNGSETDHGYVTAGSDFNLDATKAANTRSIAVELP